MHRLTRIDAKSPGIAAISRHRRREGCYSVANLAEFSRVQPQQISAGRGKFLSLGALRRWKVMMRYKEATVLHFYIAGSC
jgi:hypothetical protein